MTWKKTRGISEPHSREAATSCGLSSSTKGILAQFKKRVSFHGWIMPQTTMVNGQILPVGVSDRGVIGAMLAVPRQNFVPATLRPIAHIDSDLQLIPGLGGSPSRFLMAPGPFARLLEAARIRRTDTVLDIGCATGYSSAVIARIGGSVTALECDEELAATATTNLADLNIENVAVVTGPLKRGWPACAPYDVIVMGGSVQSLPDALVPQLMQGGRLVTIVDHGGVSSAHLYIKSGSAFGSNVLFDVATKPLPGFSEAKTFTF